MKERFKTIVITTFRVIAYPIIYTVIFGLLIYVLRTVWFYGYSLIDEYLLIIYIVCAFVLLACDYLYKTSIGIFLMPIALFVVYLSYWLPPSQIHQYTHVASCTKGDVYVGYSGPRNGSTSLVYNPGNKSIPAEVNLDKKEIVLHTGVNLSQYGEECEVAKAYTMTEYNVPEWYKEN